MRATLRCFGRAGGLIAVVLAIACDDPTAPPAPQVAAVAVTGPRTALLIGESIRLVAQVLDSTGSIMAGQPVRWSSTDATVASVESSGVVRAHAGGTAFIKAASGDAVDSLQISVTPPACSAASASGTLSLGDARNGHLGPSDCLFDGQAADGWSFTITTPTFVSVRVTSASQGVEFFVTDSQLSLIAFGFEEEMVLSLPAGRYIAWARALPNTSVADYHVTLGRFQTPPCGVSAGTIDIGQTVSGQLAATDCVFLPDYYADSWHLTLSSAATVQVDLTSAEFDAVLLLTTATGEWLTFDDDGGGNLNSRITTTLPAGDYFLVASSYMPLTTGQYTLSVQQTTATDRHRGSDTVNLRRSAARDRKAELWPFGIR